MSYFSSIDVLSVSQVTASIKSLLESEYRFVHIQGEISNLIRPHSGHLYFTLKDESSRLKSVLFKGQQKFLEHKITEGSLVICHGRISVYEPRGDYQLIVDTVDFQGSGRLFADFEKLKRKLQAEGLFDAKQKKDIPSFPDDIVVITSPTGAAIQDFLKICQLRNTNCRIRIYPVKVQGIGSTEEICRAIERTNRDLAPDMIVLIRGGGAIEDLWTFNEEDIARAIGQSEIPIVTGIGHEIDLTIADLCSDLRTPTPTAAAEQVIFNKKDIRSHINQLRNRLLFSCQTFLDSNIQNVTGVQKSLGDLDSLFIRYSLDLDNQFSSLVHLFSRHLLRYQSRINSLHSSLKFLSPEFKLEVNQERIYYLREKLIDTINKRLTQKENELSKQLVLLDAVNPLATLSRGFSITRKRNEVTGEYTVVRSADSVLIHDRLQIILGRGKLLCQVIAKDD